MPKKELKAKMPDSQLRRVVEFAQVMMTYHSDDSLTHFQHVKRYTKLLCIRYNKLYPAKAISSRDLEYIYEGAKLHDIGKISVPDTLLRKKGPLMPEEFDEMKRHTIIGAQIIDSMADIYQMDDERMILHDICMYHHERFDGGGYPEGLAGNDIPLAAQIVSIAEVYDALTESNYKDPVSHTEAMEKIISGECGVFNPELIACLKEIENDLCIMLETPEEERWELIEGVYSKNHHSYWVATRVINVIFSSLALVILSPVMLAIAAAIYIDDPKGSPVFRQTRVGRHKRPFTMYKFRTMMVDAEARKAELEAKNEKDGPVFKISDDPRITRVGKFLRKTSLDELPQLLNVLKGDMTIVGPRPPLPDEVEQYSRYQEMRLSVTPGLTCIWQSQPERDNIGFEQWMDMDVSYIGTRSVIQDVKIIFKTGFQMLHRSGS